MVAEHLGLVLWESVVDVFQAENDSQMAVPSRWATLISCNASLIATFSNYASPSSKNGAGGILYSSLSASE